MDRECKSDYFDTQIPKIFPNNTVGPIDLLLGSCQHQTGFNVKYSCKIGEKKYTIYKKVYAPSDNECAAPLNQNEVFIFKHDLICKEDKINGGFMKIHCGDDTLLHNEMPKIPSIYSPQLYNNPKCQLSGVYSDSILEYPEMQQSWLFICHAKYTLTARGPVRQYNYRIDFPPAFGPFPGYGARGAFQLRLQHFHSGDTTCSGAPIKHRMLKYPAVAPLDKYPECLPDPLFTGKFYHNAPFTAPFVTPYVGMQGWGDGTSGGGGNPNPEAMSCYYGTGISPTLQSFTDINTTLYSCAKFCSCDGDYANSTLPCEWSSKYMPLPNHYLQLYQSTPSTISNLTTCSTPGCNVPVTEGLCGPKEFLPKRPTAVPTLAPTISDNMIQCYQPNGVHLGQFMLSEGLQKNTYKCTTQCSCAVDPSNMAEPCVWKLQYSYTNISPQWHNPDGSYFETCDTTQCNSPYNQKFCGPAGSPPTPITTGYPVM